MWSFFEAACLITNFILFLNSILNSCGEDDFNLFKGMCLYFIFFNHLIIPNTFSSDSGYICCEETQGHTVQRAVYGGREKAERRGWCSLSQLAGP